MTEVCEWFYGARIQRKNEVARGSGLEGTGNFNDKCFICNGDNVSCGAYYVLSGSKAKEEYERGERLE